MVYRFAQQFAAAIKPTVLGAAVHKIHPHHAFFTRFGQSQALFVGQQIHAAFRQPFHHLNAALSQMLPENGLRC